MVFNDCFYSAMEHNFDFVATLDVDEVRRNSHFLPFCQAKQPNVNCISKVKNILYQVIMPLKHLSLAQLLFDLEEENQTKQVASYTFRNTYFMDSMKLTDTEVESSQSTEMMHCILQDCLQSLMPGCQVSKHTFE